MEFLKAHQLNIMLFMSGMCGILAILSSVSRVLSPKRRRILTVLETAAMLLLIADYYAYTYRGDASQLGFVMVRVSNFLVYFLALFMIHEISLYVWDLLHKEIGLDTRPRRLVVCEILFSAGVLLMIISQFTGLYYTFDETNTYSRGPGNIISFLIPTVIALLQLSIVLQYRKRLSRLIVISLTINTIVPLIASVIQIFAYGLSLTNMSLVGVAIVLYVFVLFDMNKTVKHSREKELEFYQKEKERDRSIFEQTAESLASAIDAKDKYTHGHSSRVAEYSRKIARENGKSEEECEQIYFAALLHDVGKIGIADSIINKEGKLTEEEYAQIKLHPVYGYQILSKISASPYLSIGARYHHERYDGRGYPDGLAGEDIPETARIIAVADAYDAMTSMRSYRETIPQQKVREELVKGMGTQFDPVFAKTMLHLIDLDTEYRMQELANGTDSSFDSSLICEKNYQSCTTGILMNDCISRIHFTCRPLLRNSGQECMPAAVLFDSLDALAPETEKKKKDLNYYEFALIRLDGENWHTDDQVSNETEVEMTEAFPGWDEWKNRQKQGIECAVSLRREGDAVLLRTENLGIRIQSRITVRNFGGVIYAALTGDQCVLADIRVLQEAGAAAG